MTRRLELGSQIIDGDEASKGAGIGCLDLPDADDGLRHGSDEGGESGQNLESLQHIFIVPAGSDITLVGMTDVAATWRRVQQHAGEVFTTVKGKQFRYSASEGGIDMLTTNRSLPRADFEEALRRMPVAGPSALQDLQGPSYLYAILNDPRIQ